jgi:hypothetical protein
MRRDYNMDLKPWRTNGQSHFSLSTKTTGMEHAWRRSNEVAQENALANQAHSDRPIVIRWHPGDWKAFPNYKSTLNNLVLL